MDCSSQIRFSWYQLSSGFHSQFDVIRKWFIYPNMVPYQYLDGVPLLIMPCTSYRIGTASYTADMKCFFSLHPVEDVRDIVTYESRMPFVLDRTGLCSHASYRTAKEGHSCQIRGITNWHTLFDENLPPMQRCLAIFFSHLRIGGTNNRLGLFHYKSNASMSSITLK
ncbi:uncharacterized protein LOC134214052 [Armigeres subalbatus]|uniref:uncharacterized protein LOC134214052 n=1 Tax=Armigeres subalbatus TaxID=124917 RepID=UPI002ED25007